MMPIVVLCVWVAGPYPYTAEWVIRLERMVRRFLARPFSFICLTDRPRLLPEVETRTVDTLRAVVPDNGVGYWQKVRLFDPALCLPFGRRLYLDLDSLVVGRLEPIVDLSAPIASIADVLAVDHEKLTEAQQEKRILKRIDQDRYGRTIVRKFNSSVMVWDAGEGERIWRTWTPAVAQKLSTDQDWFAVRVPEACRMPSEWFPRISSLLPGTEAAPTWPIDAKVVLTKKPKNDVCLQRWPWFDREWGGA